MQLVLSRSQPMNMLVQKKGRIRVVVMAHRYKAKCR